MLRTAEITGRIALLGVIPVSFGYYPVITLVYVLFVVMYTVSYCTIYFLHAGTVFCGGRM